MEPVGKKVHPSRFVIRTDLGDGGLLMSTQISSILLRHLPMIGIGAPGSNSMGFTGAGLINGFRIGARTCGRIPHLKGHPIGLLMTGPMIMSVGKRGITTADL